MSKVRKLAADCLYRGITDPAAIRAKAVAFGIPDVSEADLKAAFEIEGRRAAERAARPKPPPAPAKPRDPYWTLWGKLKARHRRDEGMEERVERLGEPGVGMLDEFAAMGLEDYTSRRSVLCLPRRGTEIDYDGSCLVVAGHRKAVKNDAHAVNTLRKLDTDDAYYAALAEE